MTNEDKMFELMEKMYGEIINLKNGQANLQNELSNIKAEVKENRKAIEENSKHIEQNGRAILRVESKLENKTNEKVTTLFDAHLLTQNKLDAVDEKIDHLQLEVNNLSIKTTHNDSKIIELSRSLKSVK